MSVQTHAQQPVVEQVAWSRLWWVGLLAIVVSVVVNLVARFILLALLPIPAGFPPFDMSAISIFTTLGVVAAIIVFMLVGRFARRPARTYFWIASIVFWISIVPNVLSALDPAATPIPNGTPTAFLALIVFHAITALIVVWLLTTRAVVRS